MKFNAARFAVMAACVAVAASAHAQTGDWGDLAVVSGTLGNNANRLCLGVPASMRPADIGCPVYAPYVSPTNGFVGIGTTSPLSQLHLGNQRSPGYGHLTLGGSNNAGLITFLNPSGSPHGLVGYVSTTDNEFGITANGGSGYISLKTGGAERMRVVNGGSVGIGTTTPSTTLQVSGTLRISNGGEACDANRAGAIRYTSSSVFQFCMGSGWQNLADAAGGGQADRITSGTTSVIATEDRSVTISTAGTQRVVIGENGRVGIGTTNPGTQFQVDGGPIFANGTGTSLYVRDIAAFRGRITNDSGASLILSGGTSNITHVSGSFIVSTSAQTTTPSLYVGTNGNVGIGTSSPTAMLAIEGGAMRINHNDQGRMFFGAPTSMKKGIGTLTGDVSIWVNKVAGHGFHVRSDAYTGPSLLFVNTYTGNVGIGTTNPNKALDVSGSANISGTVKIAGSGAEPCDSSSVGTIRYNAAAQAFQMCRP